jgi:FkbH-like protein
MSLSIIDFPWLSDAPDDFSSRCRSIGRCGEDHGRQIQLLANFRLNARQSLALSRAIERCRSNNLALDPLTSFRLGVLSNGTADVIIDCLPAACARHGVAVQILSSPFDQVMQQALDPASAINTAQLDAVLVAVDHHWFSFEGMDLAQDPERRVANAIESLRSVVEALRRNGNAPAILQTIPVPPYSVFGSYERLVNGSVRWLIERCNHAIVALAQETGSYFLDTAALAERVGCDRWFDPLQWLSYKFSFSADCCPIYAESLGRLVAAIRGKSRKCLVLDLDNTLWGGVIGDDGLEGILIGQGNATGEAFLSVQRLALQLRNRGIFVAVCSKNDDAVARQPFKEHAEMLLREEHFSVFQANWLDKASNLEAIAKALNIGLDALVLLDDNPAERAQVRSALPMVAIPELPNDPSWYAWILSSAGYFEAVTFSAEDRLRVDAVSSDARREEVRATSRDLTEYLNSLEMIITCGAFDAAGRQRISQLINKTNQFNLTTKRYTELEVAEAEADPTVFTLQARLKDKFGDLGMIGVVIARPIQAATWEIDTWLMSCRVLGRGVEQAMLSKIVSEAKTQGIRRIVGKYIPTSKNGMVAEHYKKLGFSQINDAKSEQTLWQLSTGDYAVPRLPMRISEKEKPEILVEPAQEYGQEMVGKLSTPAQI